MNRLVRQLNKFRYSLQLSFSHAKARLSVGSEDELNESEPVWTKVHLALENNYQALKMMWKTYQLITTSDNKQGYIQSYDEISWMLRDLTHIYTDVSYGDINEWEGAVISLWQNDDWIIEFAKDRTKMAVLQFTNPNDPHDPTRMWLKFKTDKQRINFINALYSICCLTFNLNQIPQVYGQYRGTSISVTSTPREIVNNE